jgi:AraC-like DNA-binding protein
MNHSLPDTNIPPIATALASKVLPYFIQSGVSRLVVARTKKEDLSLPSSVTVSTKPLRGRRTNVKGRRTHGNVSLITARWQEDRQEVTRAPAISFVISGQADMQIGSYVLHIPQSYAFLVPPGVPHPDGTKPHLEGERLKDGHCDILTFALRGNKVQCWICHSRGAAHCGPDRGENIFVLSARAGQYLDAINEELTASKQNYADVTNALLISLLLTIKRDIEAGHFLYFHGGAEEKAHPTSDFNGIDQAEKYIRSHFDESLTIESVANTIYMSRAQFAKKFHEQTGETFLEYLNKCRLEQARAFLRETDWNMRYIAEFVGFKSPSYLGRLFQAQYGMTPQAFRLASNREIQDDRALG